MFCKSLPRQLRPPWLSPFGWPGADIRARQLPRLPELRPAHPRQNNGKLVALAPENYISSGHSLSPHSGKRREDVELAVSGVPDQRSENAPKFSTGFSSARTIFLFVVASKLVDIDGEDSSPILAN
jgi:hypothetical protein